MTRIFSALLAGLLAFAVAAPASGTPAFGGYDWPVEGPVIGAFDSPDSPFSAGHRGIDIAVPSGTEVLAPSPGKVAFAGPVAGSLFVSVDHPDGVRTTYSWLSSVAVRRGQEVGTGDVLALTGWGHAASSTPHLHFGARYGGEYIDPLSLLNEIGVSGFIRLAPMPA
ncbi:MAG: M23 family metallopeptidase [Actinomycetota bacterium]